MFKDTISLREHFRCMPEIIGFSNRISYTNEPLYPLRQYPANRLEPIMSKYLPHGYREGGSTNPYNEVEADEIVTTIKECINNKEYNGKTIGVISLLGNNQAKLIQTKLIAEIGAEVMEERQIICGDAYAFQGDERDVIFLSMVAAKGETRITALTTESARQRFNVAASRAKDQLWLMHSISVNDIGNRECMRYQLLSYMADPLKEESEMNREKCESKFEMDVFDAIIAKGYQIIPQFEVAGYRLDFVIQGEKTRLAVECDGDTWHTSFEDQEYDFQRERVLQRAGWTFWRVFASTYYNNPEKALESLWAKLDEMGITPFLERPYIIPFRNELINEYKKDTNSISVDPIATNNSNDNMQNHMDFELFLDEKEITQPTMLKMKNSSKAPTAHVEQAATYEQISLLTDDEIEIETGPEQIQFDLTENADVENYKNKLINMGFNAFINPHDKFKVYVNGDLQLEKELSYNEPRNNKFTFLKDGNIYTNNESAWYVDMSDNEKASSKTINLGDKPKNDFTASAIVENNVQATDTSIDLNLMSQH